MNPKCGLRVERVCCGWEEIIIGGGAAAAATITHHRQQRARHTQPARTIMMRSDPAAVARGCPLVVVAARVAVLVLVLQY